MRKRTKGQLQKGAKKVRKTFKKVQVNPYLLRWNHRLSILFPFLFFLAFFNLSFFFFLFLLLWLVPASSSSQEENWQKRKSLLFVYFGTTFQWKINKRERCKKKQKKKKQTSQQKKGLQGHHVALLWNSTKVNKTLTHRPVKDHDLNEQEHTQNNLTMIKHRI